MKKFKRINIVWRSFFFPWKYFKRIINLCGAHHSICVVNNCIVPSRLRGNGDVLIRFANSWNSMCSLSPCDGAQCVYVHFGTAYKFRWIPIFIHEFSCACSRPFAIHMNRKCTLLFPWKENRAYVMCRMLNSIKFPFAMAQPIEISMEY